MTTFTYFPLWSLFNIKIIASPDQKQHRTDNYLYFAFCWTPIIINILILLLKSLGRWLRRQRQQRLSVWSPHGIYLGKAEIQQRLTICVTGGMYYYIPWYFCMCLTLCDSCTSLWYQVITGSLLDIMVAWRLTVEFSGMVWEVGLMINLGAASLRSVNVNKAM